MTDIPLIYDDPREIEAIFFFGDYGGGHEVGQEGVTEIVAYKEMGQGSYVAFYAVKKGDQIAVRLPAHLVSVHYKMPDTF